MGKSSRKKRQISDIAGKPTAESSPETKGLHAGGRVVPYLIIAAVGLVAYSNTFSNPFVFDDGIQIATNAMIKSLSNFALYLKGHHFSLAEGFYFFSPGRIVGYLTFALNYAVSGLDVTGYHVFNLAIHVLNSVLVYFLVTLTFRTPYFQGSGAGNQGLGTSNQRGPVPGSQYPVPDFIALFSALLFVSHPVQTQAVTYVSQRFASLATLFYLLSLAMYIKGRLASQKQIEVEAKGKKKSSLTSASTFYVLSLVSAFLAMKTKEISFTLPLIVVLYEFLFFSAPLRKRLLFILPMLLLLIIIPLTLLGVHRSLGELLSDVTNITRVQTNISRTDYFLTELTVIPTYIRLIFLPINQNLDYDYPVYNYFFTPKVFLSFIFLLVLFGTAVWLLYKSQRAERGAQSAASFSEPHAFYRLIGFGILWFFITLSVESSIIPIVDVIFEHRIYLPSAGFFIAVTAGVCLLVNRLAMRDAKGTEQGAKDSTQSAESKAFGPLRFFKDPKPYAIGSLLFALLIVVLASATVMRNAVWRSEAGLWEDVVKKSPRKARGLHTLTGIYLRTGRIEEARSLLKELSEMTIDSRDVREGYYLDLAALNSQTGALDEAEAALRMALEVNRNSLQAYGDLCSLYIKKNQLQEAFDACNNALRIVPNYPPTLTELSTVYRKLGKIDEAIRSAETALIYDPEYAPSHNNLGLAYVQRKKFTEAAMEFRNALLLEPSFAEAYNNLAGTYMVSGKYANAIEELRKAVQIDPNYVQSHYNLGAIYYVTGNRPEAMKELAILQKMSPRDADALTAFMQQKQGEQPPR